MVVTVNGQLYDIGGELADIANAGMGRPSCRREVVDSPPAGADVRDWGLNGTTAGEFASSVSAMFAKGEALDPQEVQKLRELYFIFMLIDASRREEFFSGSQDTIQQVRKQVLAVSRSLKDAMRSP
jgi:hypothetical protein